MLSNQNIECGPGFGTSKARITGTIRKWAFEGPRTMYMGKKPYIFQFKSKGTNDQTISKFIELPKLQFQNSETRGQFLQCACEK